MTLHQVLESLIFASPKPITVAELLAALKAASESSEKPEAQEYGQVDAEGVLSALGELQQQIDASERAFQLIEQVNGWALVSRAEYAPWVRKLFPEAKPTRLSGPALETLAIIAYRQPVTRADIEAVRGVAVDGVMGVLLDRSLVRISGRADVPGRPLLYSTTGYFLEHFGLKSTGELPNADELMRLDLPKAKITEEKPAPKGRGKKLEGTEEEDVAAAPVDSLVEIVHEENKGPFAPSQEAESPEQPPLTARAHPFFAEDDEEQEVEEFEEVGELIEDGCVVEPGDDDDEEQEDEEDGDQEEESEDQDLNVDGAELEEPSETGGDQESDLSPDEMQEGEDKSKSDDETP
jgi:segregation and condensation protein B